LFENIGKYEWPEEGITLELVDGNKEVCEKWN